MMYYVQESACLKITILIWERPDGPFRHCNIYYCRAMMVWGGWGWSRGTKWGRKLILNTSYKSFTSTLQSRLSQPPTEETIIWRDEITCPNPTALMWQKQDYSTELSEFMFFFFLLPPHSSPTFQIESKWILTWATGNAIQ